MSLDFDRKELKNNINVSETSYIKNLLVLSTGLIIILGATYILLGIIIDLFVKYVPVSIEEKIGHLIIKDIGDDKGLLYLNDSKKLQLMVDELQNKCTHLPYDLRVSVIKDNVENALALPGGLILVTTTLFKKSKTENELIFILSHELGHYYNKDHLKKIGRNLVVMILLSIFIDYGDFIKKSINQLFSLSDLRYSREQEKMADRFALDTLNCFYGHVGGALNFFNRDKNSFSNISKFYLTHPTSKERVKELKKRTMLMKFKEGQTVKNLFYSKS